MKLYPNSKDIPRGWKRVVSGELNIDDLIWDCNTEKFEKCKPHNLKKAIGWYLYIVRRKINHPHTNLFK